MPESEITKSIKRGKVVAKRLTLDIDIAQSSWAHFEAINGDTMDRRRRFREAGSYLLVSMNGLRAALVRDVLLALFRTLDADKKSLCLCEISKLVRSEDLKRRLIDRARSIAPHFLMDVEANRCERDIQLIIDRVPRQWNNASPKINDLHNWRNDIEPIRLAILAHPGEIEGIKQPDVNSIRHGLSLISDLVRASQRIFCDSAPTDTLNPLLRSANDFWDYAELGFIEATERDWNLRSQT